MLPGWTVCIPSNSKSTERLTSPLNWRLDKGLATAKIKMPPAQLTFRTATDMNSATRVPRSPALGAEQEVGRTHSWVFWLHEPAIPPGSFSDTRAVPNTTKVAVQGLGPAFLPGKGLWMRTFEEPESRGLTLKARLGSFYHQIQKLIYIASNPFPRQTDSTNCLSAC